MGLKHVYNCDICGDRIKDVLTLYGVCFSDNHTFALGGYAATEGKHICFNCAYQLQQHLTSGPIAKELAQHNAQHTPAQNGQPLRA